MSINPSPPYYLIYLFIAGLSFTAGNIAALLCIWEARGLKSSEFDLFSCLAAFSAVTSVEAQFMTPKDSFHPSLPGCSSSALSALSLFYLSESGGAGGQWDVKGGAEHRRLCTYLTKTYNTSVQPHGLSLPLTAAGS